MNYFYVKNKYTIVKYDYNDSFEIKIYYLNENNCQIAIKRTDSESGWGLILQIIIYDDNDNSQLITIGNSEENYKYINIETNIKLQMDDINKTTIPKIVFPRDEFIIDNNYELIKNTELFIDYHIALYYIEDYKIKIIIRRLDEESGWDNNLKMVLYENNDVNKKELITIGPSELNFKYVFKNTKIKISKKNNDYYQEIPKIIFQTGYKNSFKSILHFNSIISFIELNPEYYYIYFNDHDSRIFLKTNFSDEINHSYDVLVAGAYKADLIRYCFLYNRGGCYFDCKQILRTPIRSFLENIKKIVLCNDVIDKALLNAVIFSTVKNPIIEKTIKDCVYNIIHKLGTNALDITGPTFFYKSIKKYVNTDNLLLQNRRPLDNFNDFSNDYYGNNIKLIKNGKIILNRFYKGYYNDYLNTNHYGKLYTLNEIYYKNFQNINNYKVGIYPNKFNDKFLFNIYKDDNNTSKLNVKRIDSKDGWKFNLKVLIINENLNENIIEVGECKENTKTVNIY